VKTGQLSLLNLDRNGIALQKKKKKSKQNSNNETTCFHFRCAVLNAFLVYLIINIIFVTDWLEEMDDEDRMEFEGKFSPCKLLIFHISEKLS